MAALIRVKSVQVLEDWQVRVWFTNGEQRTIDLLPYIGSGPIFEPVRNDYSFFQAMRVDGGTVVWPNGADIDPDVLYYGGTPSWAQPLRVVAQEAQ